MDTNVKKHLALLGFRATDRVTCYKGVITSIGFDLYGCVQAIVTPDVDDKGDVVDSRWFDIARLRVTGKKPVMEQPDWDYGPVAEGKKGPADRPVFYKH